MQQKVILVGLGKVWKTFLKQVLVHDSISSAKHNNPTVVIWAATKDSLIFSPYWLKDNEIEKIISWDKIPEKSIKLESTNDILKIIKKAWLNWEVIFIDATAGKDDMRDFHLAVIEESDNFLVTANKNPVSLYDIDIFKRLTKNRRYQYTTTVMAGSGIVRFMRWTKKISDTIHSLSWVFSGTLWYITWELEKWKKISQVIREAYDLWYTEPNPWDDLNWLDVARKLVILARSWWFNVNIQDIKVIPLLPESFWKIKSLNDFFEATKLEDDNISKQVEKAIQEWKVLRYIASLENKNWSLKLEVWLRSVDKHSAIWWLSGPANLVQIISDIFTKNSPYVLQAPWAWLELSSWWLRKDMLSFLPSLEHTDDTRMK